MVGVIGWASVVSVCHVKLKYVVMDCVLVKLKVVPIKAPFSVASETLLLVPKVQ